MIISRQIQYDWWIPNMPSTLKEWLFQNNNKKTGSRWWFGSTTWARKRNVRLHSLHLPVRLPVPGKGWKESKLIFQVRFFQDSVVGRLPSIHFKDSVPSFHFPSPFLLRVSALEHLAEAQDANDPHRVKPRCSTWKLTIRRGMHRIWIGWIVFSPVNIYIWLIIKTSKKKSTFRILAVLFADFRICL